MHAEKLFEQMKAIVERAGYPLLTSYKVDLYGHLEKPLRVWQNVGASNLT